MNSSADFDRWSEISIPISLHYLNRLGSHTARLYSGALHIKGAPAVMTQDAFGHFVGPYGIVKNAPFSAELVYESIQTLYDGNRIVHRSSTLMYRDSQGRTRSEHSFKPYVQPGVANVERKSITIFNLPPGAPCNSESSGKHESLGKQMIDGVEAEGIRITHTIPAGAMGNERPIEIFQERWHSQELQMDVMTKWLDPRAGETTHRVTNLTRSEPDASLFQPPSDYTVREAETPHALIKKLREKNREQNNQ